jgi:hypothetical protein
MSNGFTLGFIPFWYFVTNSGKPNGAGTMRTWRSLNPTEIKNVYSDIAGTQPYPQPININLNGVDGPFYFEFDPDNPQETYFIQVFDSQGNLVWDIDNYSPPSGSGGGSVVTQVLPLKNYVSNSLFWRNVGSFNTSLSTSLILCPGNHAAFEYSDIGFYKSSTVNTDSVTFRKFTPFGDTPLTGDVTPLYYLNYTCTTSIAGEVFKEIRIPIVPNVTNLSNQDITLTLWGRSNAGPENLILKAWQYFGTFGSADVFTTATFALTSEWQKFTISFTLPDVSAGTLGPLSNDGLYFVISYPLNVSCNIDIAKPSFYLGDINPQTDFDIYDQTDSIINAPRVGEVLTTMNPFFSGAGTLSPYGYVYLGGNNSIGSAASSATQRANVDTYFLYKLLWTQVTQTFPDYPVSGGKGVSPQADFIANKPLFLPDYPGNVIAGAFAGNQGQVEPLGSRTHTLTVNEIAPHNHPATQNPLGTEKGPSSLANYTHTAFDSATVPTQGEATPFNIMQPTVYNYMYMKL